MPQAFVAAPLEIDPPPSPHYFSSGSAKVFILNGLWVVGMAGSGQNLDPERLTAKIFRNKELASDCADRDPLLGSAVEKLLREPSRMERACSF